MRHCPLINPRLTIYVVTMTGWDVLNNILNGFPPVATTLLLAAAVAAAIIFIVGFSRHEVVKHGFKQSLVNELASKLATKEDINKMEVKFDTRFAEIDAKIMAIETNHFGRLKDFLTELTSILLDKGVISNQDKARLDNKLRGM
jgi:hypothetical protein